eukprot:SAG31_NODE_769_length_12212_cov_5.357508_8_plen_124_part_00
MPGSWPDKEAILAEGCWLEPRADYDDGAGMSAQAAHGLAIYHSSCTRARARFHHRAVCCCFARPLIILLSCVQRWAQENSIIESAVSRARNKLLRNSLRGATDCADCGCLRTRRQLHLRHGLR